MFTQFLQDFVRCNPNKTFDPETWDHHAFHQGIAKNGSLAAMAQELKKVSKDRVDEQIMDIEQSVSEITRKMSNADMPNGCIANQYLEMLNPFISREFRHTNTASGCIFPAGYQTSVIPNAGMCPRTRTSPIGRTPQEKGTLGGYAKGII